MGRKAQLNMDKNGAKKVFVPFFAYLYICKYLKGGIFYDRK